ncbi:hypothetical protein ACEPAI_1704 [Sanghuangporus weigelae]
MSRMLALLYSLAFSAFLPSVTAKFVADSLTKGDLAVWCIFDFVYIVIALSCLAPIFRLKAHRSPYFALCAATVFSVVQCSVDIGYIVTSEQDTPQTIVALGSTIVLFSNWSSPLLYLALWLLLFDRYKQWRKHDVDSRSVLAMDKLLFRTFLGLFAVLVLLSTLSSALYANQLSLQARLVELEVITRNDLQRTRNAAQMYLNAGYVFSAFWFFSALCITALSVYVHESAKRVRANDQITKIMLFVIAPLYFIGMIQGIVFTIYFSPSVQLTSETEVEDLTLASDVVNNFIYAMISIVVLALGLKTEYWRAPDQIVALSNLGAVPAGRYSELDDTQSTK